MNHDDIPSAKDLLQRKLEELAAIEPEPELAENELESVSHAVEMDVEELHKLAEEAEEQAAEDLVHSACAMMNAFLEVDPDWVFSFLTAHIFCSEKIIEAAKTGKLPLTLTPTKSGGYVTGILGMLNAYLLWLGAKNKVAAHMQLKDGKPSRVVTFEPWVKR